MPRNSRIDCSSSTTRILPTRALCHGHGPHRSSSARRPPRAVPRAVPSDPRRTRGVERTHARWRRWEGLGSRETAYGRIVQDPPAQHSTTCAPQPPAVEATARRGPRRLRARWRGLIYRQGNLFGSALVHERQSRPYERALGSDVDQHRWQYRRYNFSPAVCIIPAQPRFPVLPICEHRRWSGVAHDRSSDDCALSPVECSPGSYVVSIGASSTRCSVAELLGYRWYC